MKNQRSDTGKMGWGPLSAEQSKLAADNFDLIQMFVRSRFAQQAVAKHGCDEVESAVSMMLCCAAWYYRPGMKSFRSFTFFVFRQWIWSERFIDRHYDLPLDCIGYTAVAETDVDEFDPDLLALVDRLDPKERDAVRRVTMFGESASKIGGQYGMTRQAICLRASRGLEKLRRRLGVEA